MYLESLKMNYEGWLWLYGSWIYNYLCNQCLSPLKLWIRISIRRGVIDTTLCDTVCQWLATGQGFSPGTLISSTKYNWQWPPQYNLNIVESGIKHHNPIFKMNYMYEESEGQVCTV
jgi:hypothetical protein